MSRPITFVDLYCGCGGMTTGAHEAFNELGLPFREIAINHWLRAIQTMQANHPEWGETQIERVAILIGERVELEGAK